MNLNRSLGISWLSGLVALLQRDNRIGCSLVSCFGSCGGWGVPAQGEVALAPRSVMNFD